MQFSVTRLNVNEADQYRSSCHGGLEKRSAEIALARKRKSHTGWAGDGAVCYIYIISLSSYQKGRRRLIWSRAGLVTFVSHVWFTCSFADPMCGHVSGSWLKSISSSLGSSTSFNFSYRKDGPRSTHRPPSQSMRRSAGLLRISVFPYWKFNCYMSRAGSNL